MKKSDFLYGNGKTRIFGVSDDYTTNSSDVVASTKCVYDAIKSSSAVEDITGENLNTITKSGDYISKSGNESLNYPFTSSTFVWKLDVTANDKNINQTIVTNEGFWVRVSKDGGTSWTGWTPNSLNSNTELNIYISKDGSLQNTGLTPDTPVSTIDRALQIARMWTPTASNSFVRFRLDKGNWGTLILNSLPYPLVIQPYGDEVHHEYSDTLPVFDQISVINARVKLNQLVSMANNIQQGANVYVENYFRFGYLHVLLGGMCHVVSSTEIMEIVDSKDPDLTAAFRAYYYGQLICLYQNIKSIESTSYVSGFLRCDSGASIQFHSDTQFSTNEGVTITGKKYQVMGPCDVNLTITKMNTMPGSEGGIIGSGVRWGNGTLYGDGSTDKFLAADGMWKQLTASDITLPSNVVLSDNTSTISGAKTFSKTIKSSAGASTWVDGAKGNTLLSSTKTKGSFVPFLRYETIGGDAISLDGYQGALRIDLVSVEDMAADTNSVKYAATLLNESGDTTFPGTVTADAFSGNSTSASKLATARTIQTNLASTTAGSFDGSKNITVGVSGVLPVANGGTGRTDGKAPSLVTARTIGITGVVTGTATAFDGTKNISIDATKLNIEDTGVTGELPIAHGGTGRTDGKAVGLVTKRTIDGVYFDGTANITHFGSCSTAAATAAKVVSVPNFVLATGAEVTVRFTVTNTAASPTLNVNNTGAKAIVYRNVAISAGYLAANRVYKFVYDGTNYELIGDIDTNTTYSAASTSKAGIVQLNDTVTSTSTTQAATAHAVKLAYDKAVASSGNATTATKLQTARSITVRNYISGTDKRFGSTLVIPTQASASFDGSQNITINVATYKYKTDCNCDCHTE